MIAKLLGGESTSDIHTYFMKVYDAEAKKEREENPTTEDLLKLILAEMRNKK